MADQPAQRRLAANLAANVVGFSRLMSIDEDTTLSTFQSLLSGVVEPKLAEHRDRLFEMTGDGVLVEFASVVDAANCTVDIQEIQGSAQ